MLPWVACCNSLSLVLDGSSRLPSTNGAGEFGRDVPDSLHILKGRSQGRIRHGHWHSSPDSLHGNSAGRAWDGIFGANTFLSSSAKYCPGISVDTFTGTLGQVGEERVSAISGDEHESMVIVQRSQLQEFSSKSPTLKCRRPGHSAFDPLQCQLLSVVHPR